MKITAFCFSIAVFLLCFAACKSNTTSTGKDAPTIVAAEESVPPSSPQPDLYYYVVTTDNLLLRDKPTQNGSSSQGKLRAGEFVQGNGDVSSDKEEATIGGIPITAPFIKVSTTTPDEKNGWAFGGGLQAIYAGARNTSPDLTKLKQFSVFLQSLDLQKMESGQKAWDFVKANFASTKGTTADAAYILLQQFMRRMEVANEYFYTQLDKIQWTEDDQNLIYQGQFNLEKYPLTQHLSVCGFRLQIAEGSIFAIADFRDFEDFFAGNVTPGMKNYLQQIRKEQDKTAFDDGGIVIPLEELADRAAFWEKFNQEQPYFVLSEETQMSQQWTLEALMNGANNTPAFEYESNKLNEDFKKAWTYAASHYSNLKVGKSAKKLLDLVASEGNKKTKKVEDFLASFQSQAGE